MPNSQTKAFERIQQIRREYDQQIKRWPPHINILFPFIDEAGYKEASEKIQSQLKDIPSFDVRFNKVGYFKQKKNRVVLFLQPNDESQLQLKEIHKQCSPFFPQCLKKGKPFTPHLTLGQFTLPNDQEILKKKAFLEDKLKIPQEEIIFKVDHICFLSRADFDDPFHLKCQVPLAGTKDTIIYGDEIYIDKKREE